MLMGIEQDDQMSGRFKRMSVAASSLRWHTSWMRETKTCPDASCRDGKPNRVVKTGFFFRKDDSKTVQRFLCRNCRKNFSAATGTLTYRQRKRRINAPIRVLFSIK